MAYKRLKFIKGETIKILLKTPWDLTGFIVTSELRSASDTPIINGWHVEILENETTELPGNILLSLPASISDTLIIDNFYEFGVTLTSPTGEVKKIPMVNLTVSEG